VRKKVNVKSRSSVLEEKTLFRLYSGNEIFQISLKISSFVCCRRTKVLWVWNDMRWQKSRFCVNYPFKVKVWLVNQGQLASTIYNFDPTCVSLLEKAHHVISNIVNPLQSQLHDSHNPFQYVQKIASLINSGWGIVITTLPLWTPQF